MIVGSSGIGDIGWGGGGRGHDLRESKSFGTIKLIEIFSLCSMQTHTLFNLGEGWRKKNLFSWFLKQNCAKFVCVIISSPLWYKNVDFSFYYRQYVVVVPKLNSKRKFGYPRAAVELFSGFCFCARAITARATSECNICHPGSSSLY